MHECQHFVTLIDGWTVNLTSLTHFESFFFFLILNEEGKSLVEEYGIWQCFLLCIMLCIANLTNIWYETPFSLRMQKSSRIMLIMNFFFFVSADTHKHIHTFSAVSSSLTLTLKTGKIHLPDNYYRILTFEKKKIETTTMLCQS